MDSQRAKPATDSERRAKSGPASRTDVASFMLRFSQDRWEDESGDPHLRWRGQVRHVQSDAEKSFTDFADAVAFMQEELARLTLGSVESVPKDERAEAISESFRLWEQFSTGYADLMRETVERSLGQSESYQQRAQEMLDQGLGAWNPFAVPGVSQGTSSAGSADEAPSASDESPGDLATSLNSIHARLDEIEAAIRALGESAT